MGRIGWSDFVIWQCSLRQRNFRMFGGKPSEGTIAGFSNIKSDIQLGDIRSILMETNCEDTSKMFEFMHKQTHDPETRFDKAIKFFSSEYYTKRDSGNESINTNAIKIVNNLAIKSEGRKSNDLL